MSAQFDAFSDSVFVGDIVALVPKLSSLPIADRIEAINVIRSAVHKYSPFAHEPVDFVQWVTADQVTANDYNPNSVAPPEMRLLKHSITEDGYTQPIVSWNRDGMYEVVDGFHRHRVGKESAKVRERLSGYLPLVVINAERQDKGDRIAATIRHNRARGKHRVEAMSDIVVELKRRNWSEERIGRELGMDPDEVLRLCQITGLAEAFKDQQFSEAWEVEKLTGSSAGEVISDVIPDFEADDNGRVYHTWDKWECYRAGFFAERPANGMTMEQGESEYLAFLANPAAFEAALIVVTSQWTHSCEHNLTNDRMNRIAWLGQASAAQARGLPSCCRGGYHMLTDEQKSAADALALKYLNIWLAAHGKDAVTMEDAGGRTEAELY
jgi:ParB-like chromosome segregation protein Spo0J